MALICDHTEATARLGWKPQYTLEEGLKETIEYIRDHLDQYKTGVVNR